MPYFRVRTVTSGLAGGPYLTTFYLSNQGGSAEIAAGCVNEFWQAIKPVISDNAFMQIVNTVQTVQETTGNIINEETFTNPPSIQGTSTNGEEWTAKQGLLAWRTTTFVNGTRLSGRTFIPGVTNGAGEQVPTGAYMTAIEGAGNTLLNQATSEDCPLVAVRRPKQDPFVPGDMGFITSCVARGAWAVLRSRRD